MAERFRVHGVVRLKPLSSRLSREIVPGSARHVGLLPARDATTLSDRLYDCPDQRDLQTCLPTNLSHAAVTPVTVLMPLEPETL